MAGRIINPYQQFRDNEGFVLDAGTIRFYENGTTTPKTIYTDATFTVPQANPYTLDSAGRITGDVYLDGLYTIEIRDNLDNFIRSIDDVQTGSGGGSGTSDTVTNKCINGAMQVALGSGTSISSTFVDAPVVDYSARAVNPSAGTINQSATVNFPDPSSGKSLIIQGLTTGTGGTAEVRKQISSNDSYDLANDDGTFSCRVYYNTGVSVNYEIFFNAADAVDDFTSVTPIASSGAITVNTATPTTISFTNAMGSQVINGLEIIVVASVGIVTSRNYETTEWLMERGSTASAYDFILFEDELARIEAQQDLAPVIDVAPASTENAIVVENAVPLTTLSDGLAVFARLDHGANTSTTVTLQIDSLTARDVFRQSDQDLLIGDTGGESNVCIFFYDLSLDKFILTNPVNESFITRGTTQVSIPISDDSIDFTVSSVSEMTIDDTDVTITDNNLVLTSGEIQVGTVVASVDFEAPNTDTVPVFNFTGNDDSGLGFFTGGGVSLYDGGTSYLNVNATSVLPLVPIYSTDGTAALPAYTFSADTDSGFYRSADNTLGVSTAGTERLLISDTAIAPNLPINSSSSFLSSLVGSAATPNFQANNATTGLFGTVNSVGLSVLTTEVASSTDSLWTQSVDMAFGTNSITTVGSITGTGTFSAGTLNATTEVQSNRFESIVTPTTNFTIGVQYEFNISDVLTVGISSTGLQVYGGGNAASPAIEFASTDTGFSFTASTINFSIAGVRTSYVDANGLRAGRLAGTLAVSDRIDLGTNSIDFFANNVEILNLINGQGRFANGTLSLPGISFLNDDDTGFYLVSSGQLEVATAGVNAGFFDTTGWNPSSQTLNRENTGIYTVVQDGATGAAIEVPSGWSTTRVLAGTYSVTHNLGNTNYAVFITPRAAGNGLTWTVTGLTTTTMNFIIDDNAGTNTDTISNFIQIVTY